MRRHLTPWRVLGGVAVLLLATILILFSIPSDQYILLPDIAHPVAPLVKVQGERKPTGPGAVYFLDVIERRASELESLFRWIHPDATFVPASELVPPGTTTAAMQAAEQREMSMSQRIAAAVALRRLGYHVVVHADGVLVSVVELGTDAASKLQPADVIVAVDGTRTPTIAALRARLAKVDPGDVVTLRIRRGSRTLSVRVRTVSVRQEPGRALIGFQPAQAAEIKLPIRVSIDAGGVGGPSAGLAFALEVMKKLGRDVTHGHRVAATGEMEIDGTVAPIGGVRQKVVDARKAHVGILLVPAGENAATARHYASQLRVIPVRSFRQALHALATLPQER